MPPLYAALTSSHQVLEEIWKNSEPFFVDEPTEPPIEWNIQPPEYPPKNIPVVSSITGIINHHAIDNGDVDVHPSEFLF